MKFCLFEIGGKMHTPKNIDYYEIVSEVGTACDGLRLSFFHNEIFGEIERIEVYDDDELIFNGFCDVQKTSASSGKFKYFIYARSSASLLIDNEAHPFQYSSPSSTSLWFKNAKEFGFSCKIPEVFSKNNYLVSKGTSCYGALNNFVFSIYGTNIYVTPRNEIKVFEESEELKHLSNYNITSFLYTINRSEPISDVDYKINAYDNYVYHFKSKFAEQKGIKRRRLYNLSSIPAWQRENTVSKKINDSIVDYYSAEVIILEKCDLKLYDRVLIDLKDFNLNEEFLVYEIVKSKNKNGEKTTVVLKKKQKGDLINYVAK